MCNPKKAPRSVEIFADGVLVRLASPPGTRPGNPYANPRSPPPVPAVTLDTQRIVSDNQIPPENSRDDLLLQIGAWDERA